MFLLFVQAIFFCTKLLINCIKIVLVYSSSDWLKTKKYFFFRHFHTKPMYKMISCVTSIDRILCTSQKSVLSNSLNDRILCNLLIMLNRLITKKKIKKKEIKNQKRRQIGSGSQFTNYNTSERKNLEQQCMFFKNFVIWIDIKSRFECKNQWLDLQ